MLQPPARDYLPRRSGQTAVPGLQAYAFFHHKTYDAAEKCFVPGTVILVARDVAERTDDFFEWKSARLLLLGPGKLFARERPQNLRFREVRIVEDYRDDVRVAFGEQSARHARRAAARQRNFLAERQLWQAPEQLILGVELQLRGYSRRKRDLHEI